MHPRFRQFAEPFLQCDLHSQAQRFIDQINARVVSRDLIGADEAPAVDAVQQPRNEVFRVDIRVREIQGPTRPDEF